MLLIDQIMLYGVFALAGFVLILMGVWAWVETSPLPVPRPDRLQKRRTRQAHVNAKDVPRMAGQKT